MKQFFRKGIKLWETEVSLRIFFISILILNFVLTPLSSSQESGAFIARSFYIFLIISGSYALIKSRVITYIIILFSFVAFIVWLLSYDNNILWLTVLDGLLQVLFYLIFLFLILIKVFKGGVYSNQRLEGAMTGYLLIGNLFATLYYTINLIMGPNTFHIPGGEHIVNFTYFSFSTLTTLGYGDIVPVLPVVRSLSNLEAVIGQLYPTVLIARILSLENLRSPK
ncbi:MAG: ion channel [Ignavibacteriae bacterium]|nr:ion channel [Ignavibacteriota bacterium]